jgi:hypothetical protein
MRFRLPLIAGGGCTDCLNLSQLRRPMFAGDRSLSSRDRRQAALKRCSPAIMRRNTQCADLVALLGRIHKRSLSHTKSLRNSLGGRPVTLRKATLNELVCE